MSTGREVGKYPPEPDEWSDVSSPELQQVRSGRRGGVGGRVGWAVGWGGRSGGVGGRVGGGVGGGVIITQWGGWAVSSEVGWAGG